MAPNERRMQAGLFKATCLRVMEEVRRRRRPVVITKRGKPIAKLVPVDEEAPALFGRMEGSVAVKCDIVGPVAGDWEAAD